MANSKMLSPIPNGFKVNTFKDNISTIWKEFQYEDDFHDMTLACEDKQIQVHKLIVSGCSPILKKLLRCNPHQNPIIYLRGVKFTELENIVKYLYQGEITIPQDDLVHFLEVAKDLQIEGLIEDDKNKTPKTIDNLDSKPIKDQFPNEPPVKHIDVDIEKLIDNLESKSTTKLHLYQSEISIPVKHTDVARNKRKRKRDSNWEEFKNIKSEESEYEELHNKESEELICEELKNINCEGVPSKVNDFDQTNEDIFDDFVENNKNDNNSTTFTCEQCDYSSNTRRSVKRHVYAIHEGIRYSCEECVFSTKRRDVLVGHIKNKH